MVTVRVLTSVNPVVSKEFEFGTEAPDDITLTLGSREAGS